jgi:hypothetical protein
VSATSLFVITCPNEPKFHFGRQEFLFVLAHNNDRLSPLFKQKSSYGFPDTAGSADNQTGFADKFRSHVPERSSITRMYGNLASHWLPGLLKRSSITRESTSPDWL